MIRSSIDAMHPITPPTHPTRDLRLRAGTLPGAACAGTCLDLSLFGGPLGAACLGLSARAVLDT
jgi:hypothetical protein